MTDVLKLSFTNEQLSKLDSALDMLASKGFEEIKYQDPKMIGVTLLTYAVMRREDYGDILVQLTLDAGKCDLKFRRPDENGELRDITYSEIKQIPEV